jgi:predicted phosphodiesterase
VSEFRVGVLSDIHGNRWALEAVLEDVERRGLERLVNLGDSLYGPLDPAGTARTLLPLNLPTVRGNEDRLIVERDAEISPTLRYVRERLNPEQLHWLRSLEMTAVAYGELFLCHGSPRRDDEYLLVEVGAAGVSLRRPAGLGAITSSVEQPVLLCGHDHVPRTVRLPDGRIAVNPGSVGLPAYEDDQPRDHTMETGTPHARYSVLSRSAAGWQVEEIAVPYDWEAAASAATENGRPDWAFWLRTGRARGTG